jgi:Mg/Co/Ni transporter MgtE
MSMMELKAYRASGQDEYLFVLGEAEAYGSYEIIDGICFGSLAHAVKQEDMDAIAEAIDSMEEGQFQRLLREAK